MCFSDLYGVHVKPVAAFGSASSRIVVDSATIHCCLPDELLFEVFARLTAYGPGKASCPTGIVENYKILQSKYHWFLEEDVAFKTKSMYVSRNTYIRTGIAEWKVTNPVHLVCYFRYYTLGFTHPEDFCIRLRGTTSGSNNRLDLLALVTSGVNDTEASNSEEDVLGVVEGWQDDETHKPDVPAVTHKRGLDVRENMIGKGFSGVVYKAEMPNGEQIAVKKLWKTSKDEEPVDSFAAEIQILGHIRHRNILKLLGHCSNKYGVKLLPSALQLHIKWKLASAF
ncbi:unnamed protein product [Rhodiola kirilowii]